MNIEIKSPVKEYDVIVVGGGPSGCAAAIAAAREGADTLLIETGSALGGMATLGMVSKWAPFTDREKVIYESIPREIMIRYKERVGFSDDAWNWVTIIPEQLKIVYDEMVTESGASVLFDSRVCHCVTKDGGIDSVIVSNKAGLTPYKAKVFIDTTGDGDLAAYAGVPFEMGDENGNVQSGSLCFIISDADLSKITESVNSNPADGLWARIIADGKYPLVEKHFIPAQVGDDTVFANAGHINGLDSTDPEKVSKAYMHGRKIAEEYLAALKEYQPEAFKNAHISATAPILGVRESRRIKGEYCLTVEDYLNRRSFDDEIARNSYWLDFHGRNDLLDSFPPEKLRYTVGETHGIPWRCLIPVGIDNLLVAGRCISMEQAVLASIRVMPNCLAMGEAAGIGAAMAAKDGVGVRAVDVADIRSKIKKGEAIYSDYRKGRNPEHPMFK